VITLISRIVCGLETPTELYNFNMGLLSQFNFKIYFIVISQFDMRGALKTVHIANILFLFSCRGIALGNK
jgi:hypothetical protein